MVRKPRTWNQIIEQEGAIGLLKGEDIEVEHAYQKRLRLGKEKIKWR
jgi:hypothetical protein